MLGIGTMDKEIGTWLLNHVKGELRDDNGVVKNGQRDEKLLRLLKNNVGGQNMSNFSIM